MGEERRETESVRFIRKVEVKSPVSMRVHSILLVFCSGGPVIWIVVRLFGCILTRSRVQMPLAIAPRGRILETYNISVKRRGQVESERTVSDVWKVKGTNT